MLFVDIILFFFLIVTVTAARKVVIVTLFQYKTGPPTDIVYTGAAFDLAIQKVNQRYEAAVNVSVKHLYDPRDRSCNDLSSRSAQLIAEYYYRNGNDQRETCFAIVATRESL